MSVPRTVEFDGDAAIVRQPAQIEFTLADLFDEHGEWRIHDDGDQWEGYVRQETDDDVQFLHHDDLRDERSGYGVEIIVGDEAVRLAAQRLIEEGRLDPATLGGEQT
jgi:hypothetical protein